MKKAFEMEEGEYLATSYEETENGFLSSPKKEGRHMQALCRQEGLPSQKKWKKAFEIKEGEYLATSCEKNDVSWSRENGFPSSPTWRKRGANHRR